MRCHVPRMQNKFIEYRSQTIFNKTLFLESVADSNLRSCLRPTLEDPEHGWISFTNNFKSTIDQHAAIKKRKVRSNQPPYISTHMRKTIWIRKRRWLPYGQKALCSENICSKGSMFRRFYIQKVLCSEGSMFRRSYIQKVPCSEGPVFRKKLFKRSYIQKVLCSEGPIFRYIQKILYSEKSLFYVVSGKLPTR